MKGISTCSLIRILATVFLLFCLPQRANPFTWSQSTSAHFLLYAEDQSNQDRHVLRILEHARRFFLNAGILNSAQEHPIVVFAFRDTDKFNYYAPPQTIGYFQRGDAADYIGLLNPSSNTILHEYAHAAIATVWPRLPIWINEGLAEYYSTSEWRRESSSVGRYLWEVDAVFRSLSADELSSVLDRPGTFAEGDLAATSRRYMLSWALVHMMITQPGYAQRFRTFLDALSGGALVENAMQSTYGRTLAQIEGDLDVYLRQGCFKTVKYPYTKTGDDTSETYPDVEDFEVELKLLDVLSHSASGASKARARLEEVSIRHPDNLEIEEMLALSCWRAGDAAAAQLHANRAITLGSRNADLLLLDAQLELKSGMPQPQIIPLLEEALADNPDNYRIRAVLGYLAYESKDFPRALSLLKPIESLEGTDAFTVSASLAYSAAGNGDYSSANTYALRALKKARSDEDRAEIKNLLSWISQETKLPKAEVYNHSSALPE